MSSRANVKRRSARGWALEGLQRSATGLQSMDWHDAHISIGQALWWSCLLDETCWRESGYEEAREAHPSGRVLPGLRYARNAMGHGAAPVRSLTTLSLEGERLPYEWVPAELLDLYSPPRSPKSPRTVSERAAYEWGVAQRPLELPLRDAMIWFELAAADEWAFRSL